MKCQSDYGAETDALLRQADVCFDEWWDDEPHEMMKLFDPEAEEEQESTVIVKDEIRKRGFVDVGEEAGV
jgi:hypothetical protein